MANDPFMTATTGVASAAASLRPVPVGITA
jgi:hypothetical protein